MSRLLVIGEPRSGTTLLADLLDAQPGVRMELGVLGQALAFARDRGGSLRAPLRASERARVAAMLGADLERTRARGRVSADALATPADALARATEALRGDARIAGSKEHAPAAVIEALVTEAGFDVLYIVRDARDVILSRARRGEVELDRKLAGWRRSVRAALAVEHPRIFLVRYEDLVRDVRGTFARIDDALGLGLDPERAAAWRLTPPRRTNTSFGVEMHGVEAIAVERWRAHVDDPWVRFAGAYCAPELARLSYAAGPPMSRADALAYRARGAAAQLRRYVGDAKRRVQARAQR